MSKLSEFPLAAADAAPPFNFKEATDTKYADVIGKQFGKLKFKEAAFSNPKTSARQAVFSCDCGGEKTLVVSNVKTGLSKSCGCLRGQRGKIKAKPRTPKATKPAPIAKPVETREVEEPKTAMRTRQEPAPFEAPVPMASFRAELLGAGRDVTALIHQARKIDTSKIDALITEIERVEFSPFANVPPGALEEARAVKLFVDTLRRIEAGQND